MIKSLMEQKVLIGLKVWKPLQPELKGLSREELLSQKRLVSHQLEDLGKHIQGIEDHLSYLRAHQDCLFQRKNQIERKLIPVLIVPSRKTPSKHSVLDEMSLEEIEAAIITLQEAGEI